MNQLESAFGGGVSVLRVGSGSNNAKGKRVFISSVPEELDVDHNLVLSFVNDR